MRNNARDMTDAELIIEREWLCKEWDNLRAVLAETGGHSGSPGEWIIERLDEVNTEMRKRRKVDRHEG